MAKKPQTSSRIADNKKAAYNYFFEERHEAGMVLEGWEVKALREGKVQLTDGYVVIRNGELFLIGCQINPLKPAPTHVNPDSVRTKKLLLHKDQIKHLIIKVEQKGNSSCGFGHGVYADGTYLKISDSVPKERPETY